MRQYYDLDVLVDRPQFAAAIEALEAAGAELLDRNWPLIRRQMHAELSMMLPNGTPLDLHWGLVTQERKRHQTRVPTDADAAPSDVLVDIGGHNRPTFDPVDTVLALAVHAAHAGATRLMWLNDIACALARDGVDWSTLRARAQDGSSGTAGADRAGQDPPSARRRRAVGRTRPGLVNGRSAGRSRPSGAGAAR